jgi:hypothetical protein
MLLKLLDNMERLYRKIPSKIIDTLYLLAFALVLIYDYDYLTRFDRALFRPVYVAGAALAGIVLLLRMLNIKNECKIGLGFAIVVLLIGGSYYLVRHSFYFLVLAMLIVGALRVEDKKVFAVYLVVAMVFFAVMVSHFLITTKDWKDIEHVHFGSINSTDCQAMIFFILTAFLFYMGTNVRYIYLVAFAGIVLWFWSYTRAEINMYCSLAALAVVSFMKVGTGLGLKTEIKTRKTFGYILSISFILCAMVMIILSIRYAPDEEKWQTLNKILHSRLGTAHRMYSLYPPTLWGSEFEQVGRGYEVGVDYWVQYKKYGYTYIDSSYPYILINHGWLVLAFIIGVMTVVSCRYAKKGELYKVLLLGIIAVDCAAEGHLKEVSCIVWLILPFANLGEKELLASTRAPAPGDVSKNTGDVVQMYRKKHSRFRPPKTK